MDILLAAALAFPLCSTAPRENCVVDGDTFWLAGEKVRIVGIDAPELSQPDCLAERVLAERAAARLEELLAGGEIALNRQGEDRYGRTLAGVTVEGVPVGGTLVAEGLARPWSGRREDWCR